MVKHTLTIRRLSEFDHFVWLALKELKGKLFSVGRTAGGWVGNAANI